MENQEKMNSGQQDEKVSSVVVEYEKEYLTADIQKAANWFFWIAGLSLVNSLMHYISAGTYFVVGLGITQIVDGIISAIMSGPSWIALVPNLLITGFFVYIGYSSRKYSKWAFLTGVLIYTLDALLFLYFKEWMAVVFHIFVLFMLSRGFFKVFEYEKACKQIVE
jgi:hypothetical protein